MASEKDNRMNFSPEHMLEQIVSAGLNPPKTLTLSVTNGCNLRCRHCLPDSRFHGHMPPVPLEILQRLVSEFAHLGVKQIILAGGEPLTHPRWLEILIFCLSQHKFQEVRLQTNGTLLTKNTIGKLTDLKSETLSIQVSLDGATAEHHDHVRGKGSFDRAMAGLRALAENRLGKQTIVAFTEMQHNFEDIPLLMEMLDNMGIGGFVSGTLVKSGRALQTAHLSPPTPEQYKALLKHYCTDSTFRARYEKFGNIALVEWYKSKDVPVCKVCTCIENSYITADGQMFPCVLLHAEDFAVRNVHNRPLNEVLSEAVPVWAKLPEISRIRSAALKPCQKCPGRRHCGGGCMGRAYAATGDLMTVEDRCLLRQEVYQYLTAG